MRILMLAQFYPPIIGGEERFARDLSVSMAARGHEVSVITLWQEGLDEFELDQGVKVYRVRGTLYRATFLHADSGRRHAPSFPDPETTLAIKRIIEKERPQIVHGFNWMVYSFLPLKDWSGAKLVMSLCDHSLICPKKKLLYGDKPCSGPGLRKCLGCASDHYGKLKGVVTTATNWLSGLAEKKAVDMYLPVSYSTAQENGIVGTGLAYEVLPNFVANEVGQRHEGLESYLEQLPSQQYLMYAGAFGRYKGVDVLLEAYAGMHNAPPLVIIGYDTSEYPVQTTHLPSNVTVLKNWPNKAVMEAWRRSSLAIVPSVWAEPFGIVVLEAMATARPVIASRIGGLTDIVVDGETGLLVTPGDPAALREGIESLLADPRRREQMGAAGHERVNQFMVSAVVPRYEQVYSRLLGAAESDPASQPEFVEVG